MQNYIDDWEQIFNRLSAINSPIQEKLFFGMLLTLLADKRQSPFGHTISSLQVIQDGLKWEKVTSRLMQEYGEILIRIRIDKKFEAI